MAPNTSTAWCGGCCTYAQHTRKVPSSLYQKRSLVKILRLILNVCSLQVPMLQFKKGETLDRKNPGMKIS
eukprot:3349931-Amphidinium_carterae.1